jgi:hypothetical protein
MISRFPLCRPAFSLSAFQLFSFSAFSLVRARRASPHREDEDLRLVCLGDKEDAFFLGGRHPLVKHLEAMLGKQRAHQRGRVAVGEE